MGGRSGLIWQQLSTKHFSDHLRTSELSLAPNDPRDSHDPLDIANALADAAASHSMRWFRTSLDIITKADDSPVTLADRAAETAMREILEVRCPADGIYGEEHGGAEQEGHLDRSVEHHPGAIPREPAVRGHDAPVHRAGRRRGREHLGT